MLLARAAVDAKLDVSLAELKDALKGKLDSPENRAYFEQEYAKAAEESQGRIDGMAAAAMKVTRLLNNNPRDVNEDDARRIYCDAY